MITSTTIKTGIISIARIAHSESKDYSESFRAIHSYTQCNVEKTGATEFRLVFSIKKS